MKRAGFTTPKVKPNSWVSPMEWSFLLKRLFYVILVIYIIATLNFFIVELMPGDPLSAYIDPTFTEEQRQMLLKAFGLDQPIHIRYIKYLQNIVQGQFGTSFVYKKPVSTVLAERLPNSLILVWSATIVAYAIGVPLGIFAAWKVGSKLEAVAIIFALIGRATPVFWTGLIAITIFSFTLRWFPSSGVVSPGAVFGSFWEQIFSVDYLSHLILPTITEAFYLLGLPFLLMRTSMLEVLGEDFITMCRMKGLKERDIMFKHVARNSILPVLTVFALAVGYSLEGAILVETVFSWPGVGRLLAEAVLACDYPLAQGSFFIIAVVTVLMNFVADLLYLKLDPRVSYRKRFI